MKMLIDRIIQIANYYEVSKPSDFAKKTGLSHQVASNYLKGARIPNAEALRIIKQTFDISGDWLLTGEGNMLKEKNTDNNNVNALNGEVFQLLEKIMNLEKDLQILLTSHSKLVEINTKLTEVLLKNEKLPAGEDAECVDVSNVG